MHPSPRGLHPVPWVCASGSAIKWILWCVTAELSAWRKELSARPCKLGKISFIDKAAPKCVTWATGTTICTRFILLMDQRMGRKGMMGHPSTSNDDRSRPSHPNSKGMWVSLHGWWCQAPCLVEVRRPFSTVLAVCILGNDYTWVRKLLHEAWSAEYRTVGQPSTPRRDTSRKRLEAGSWGPRQKQTATRELGQQLKAEYP